MKICDHFLYSPLSILSFPSPRFHLSIHASFRLKPSSSSSCSVSFSLTEDQQTHDQGRSKFLEFPFVSCSHKNVMVDIVSTVENHFESQLLPCSLPSHVQFFQSHTATSQASLHIRPGHHNSPVDLVLGSWVHSELPTGGSLDITSVLAYLKSSTDAPNFMFEMIRTSPTMLVVFLDLLRRKDLVLWPDYIKTFYEGTQLDTHRQALERVPDVQKYLFSSLYSRNIVSPTTILVRIVTENGGVERMEEIIRDHLDPISKQVLEIWLDHCACAKREVGEAERAYMKKRDGFIRNKTIEIDIGSSFSKLFGQEVANRVIEAIKEYITV